MRNFCFWGLLGLGVLRSFSLSATTFIMMSDNELINASKAVCFGEITDVHSEIIDGQKRVQTIASFKPSECLKGQVPNPARLSFPGGTATIRNHGASRQIIQKVPGTPQLKIGDKGIFHFWWEGATPSPSITVTSWQRGVLPMVYDEKLKDYREARGSQQMQKTVPTQQKNSKPVQSTASPKVQTLKDYRKKVAEASKESSQQK